MLKECCSLLPRLWKPCEKEQKFAAPFLSPSRRSSSLLDKFWRRKITHDVARQIYKSTGLPSAGITSSNNLRFNMQTELVYRSRRREEKRKETTRKIFLINCFRARGRRYFVKLVTQICNDLSKIRSIYENFCSPRNNFENKFDLSL